MTEKETHSMLDLLRTAPVIPVVRIEQAEHAVPMAQALVQGGLPVIEVTLRTPAALEAAERIAREVPQAVVGIGTVTEPDDFTRARDAGARFAVSPGLTDALLEASQQVALPFLPGVMTPSEALRAAAAGFQALKLFPAEQAGGAGMLKALYGPLRELRFCPTGGVSPGNMAAYLALPNVICVGGSWLVPDKALATGDWPLITRIAASAVSEAHLARGAQTRPAHRDAAHGTESVAGEEDPGATA